MEELKVQEQAIRDLLEHWSSGQPMPPFKVLSCNCSSSEVVILAIGDREQLVLGASVCRHQW
jgi:hypothetical protein